MSFSIQRATSDGTLQEIMLSIVYINRSDIKVTVGDVPQTEGVDYAWETDSLISFTDPVPNGVEVVLRRSTDLAQLLNIFSLGAVFNNTTMDENFEQLLFVAQEAKEGATLTDLFNDVDMHGNTLLNLPKATDLTSPVTLAQLNEYAADSSAVLRFDLAQPTGSAEVGHGSGTVQDALLFPDSTVSLAPAFLEQFITGFHGRGMIAAETINVATQQTISGTAAAGAATLVVPNNAVYDLGGCVTVRHDNGKYATYFIDAIGGGGTTIGIRPALRWPVTSGVAALERTWYNQAHPGKFYMRELAQRIADTPEYVAAMPHRGRTLFSQFDSNPTNIYDLLTGIAGGSVSYFDELNLGQGSIGNPVEFNIGRTAFIGVTASGDGAQTNLFPTNGETQCTLRFVGMCRSPSAVVDVKVVDNLGRNSVVFRLPTGVSQRIPQVYNVPFKVAGDASSLKVQFIATTAAAATTIIVDQLEIFESELLANPLIPKGKECTVVLLGDSWITGNQPAQPEREGIWKQLEIERPDAIIINKGVGGNKIPDLLARFDADVVPYAPQYVVVNVGTNDCYSPSSGVFFPNAVDNFNYDYNRLISKIQAIGAKPIIVGVPALAEEDGAFLAYALNDRAKTYSRYFYKNWAARKPRVYPVVGSVSQSAGVVTGAIFEKGGDASTGYWTKYADGRLEAIRTVTVNMTITTAQTFSYPINSVAGFAVGSASLFSLGSVTSNAAHATHSLRCTDSNWTYKVETAGTIAAETVRLLMVGRWY